VKKIDVVLLPVGFVVILVIVVESPFVTLTVPSAGTVIVVSSKGTVTVS
jgi:hypothetical protein